MDGGTRYDRVQYPAGLYPTTLPDRLAAIARIHGLAAPDPATAHVLEVAGGDGVNVIAMAAAWPAARFLSFDLSAAAVARGGALAEAAGLSNVRVEVGDVIEAAKSMAGPFDYIIVHGLYAWVPEPVRVATLKLIGRLLSPNGVAFVSYNAQPGGHLRTAIREMLMHHVRDIADPAARVARAREVLRDFSAPRPTDRPAISALRQIAEPMLRKNNGSLYHDELSDCYAPVSLAEFVAAAAPHGLGFLADALPAMVYDGLPGRDLSDAETVHAAQADDYDVVTFFHQTLLVRSGRGPRRRIDPACFANLFASSTAKRTGEISFVFDEREFEVEDAWLADFLGALGEAWPRRLALSGFASSAERCDALIRLYQREIVALHAAPLPAALDPGERPCASPLARAQLVRGDVTLYTLDHRMLAFVEPGPRAFLALLDGTRDRAQLAADWAASGYGDQVSVDEALRQVAHAGTLTY
ncbi:MULTISPECIES: class I SAM-dependent methyltransferase [Sphingomonas]|nr:MULTISPECIES: class I SAM-dependent methyltransferase [Sphingomonas]MBA2920536.1 methyltransferase domain-containing protein [Sphingomonas sp. CGMCC 1.13658]